MSDLHPVVRYKMNRGGRVAVSAPLINELVAHVFLLTFLCFIIIFSTLAIVTFAHFETLH